MKQERQKENIVKYQNIKMQFFKKNKNICILLVRMIKKKRHELLISRTEGEIYISFRHYQNKGILQTISLNSTTYMKLTTTCKT